MATLVEMAVPDHRGPYPHVIIQDREDARQFVRILEKNGVAVNLREVPDNPVDAGREERERKYLDNLNGRIEHHKNNYPGTSLDI